MTERELDALVLRFIHEDVGGILINGEDGETVYEDQSAAKIRHGDTNWAVVCPPPREGQRGENWELLDRSGGRRLLKVISSTYAAESGMLQVHLILNSEQDAGLSREFGSYSGELRYEKEHDRLTGIFNKGKFMEMRANVFPNCETIAVYFLDVNGLKRANDKFGHDAGDRLICKAAESVRRVASGSVPAFRVGGDEFVLVAMRPSYEEALALRRRWEEALEEINREDGGPPCVIACGMAYGKGSELGRILEQADQNMYEDKRAKKLLAGEDPESR